MKVLPVILFFFCSCQSATKLTYKAIAKDKATVAAITREQFPCGIIARDTTIIIDTISKFVECPESTITTIVKTDTAIDTVIVKKTIKVPVMQPQRTVYITQQFEDSAKIYLMQNIINEKQKSIDKLTNKLHNRKILIIWLMIGIISLFLLIKIIK
jgi:hypothetical protein